MRGWTLALAVLLAACGGYALALLLHDRPRAPALLPAPRTEPAESFESAPDVKVEQPAVKRGPYRPEPKVRAFFAAITRGLRDYRRAYEEQSLYGHGWRRFVHEIPEYVTYRGHDFLREVEAAVERHWFAPDERAAYESAQAAWKRVRDHFALLLSDRTYRAAERRLANLAHDPRFEGLHLIAYRGEAPFLLIYAAREPLSVWDLAPSQRTHKARLAIERRRTFARRVLRRNATVHKAVHDKLRGAFGDALALGDLDAPYGGRPDYPHGVRSFADGVTLVSVVFADREAARKPSGHASWFPNRGGSGWQAFHPRSDLLLSLPRTEDDRTAGGFEAWYGSEAAAQLLYWYTRQRNRWRKPAPEQGFVYFGVASWLGAVQFDGEGRAHWTGRVGPWLRDMQTLDRRARRQGNEYKLFPVRRLAGASSAGGIRAWGTEAWQLRPELVMAMYGEQAWALAHFLHRQDGPYREAFARFLGRVLSRETGPGRTERAFADAFRLRGDEDWEVLDAAFGKFLREHLMQVDPAPYLKKSPPLAVWDR